MRAQQTTMRLMPGNDTAEVNEQLRAPRQPEPGPVRTLTMHDHPARCTRRLRSRARRKHAREQDPRRQETLQAARAVMADIFDGPPQFTDLTVAEEWTG
jgi:DNA-binding NarL/FixJ family response regulator